MDELGVPELIAMLTKMNLLSKLLLWWLLNTDDAFIDKIIIFNRIACNLKYSFFFFWRHSKLIFVVDTYDGGYWPNSVFVDAEKQPPDFKICK